MSRSLAIIQARMSSSRFPGKSLERLLGLPLIVFMAKRVQRAVRVDELIVATSVEPSDDAIEPVLTAHGVRCFRGDLHDVLDRYYRAACTVKPDYVLRLTGDCPLVDAQLIDRVVDTIERTGADYVSNIDPPSFPDGLDVECCTFAALERAWREARSPSEREHVTPYLRRKELFRCVNLVGLTDMSHLRWTIDYPDDLRLVREMLSRAGAVHPADCDRFDFYRVLEADPVMSGINRHARNEGYARSLEAEREINGDGRGGNE